MAIDEVWENQNCDALFAFVLRSDLTECLVAKQRKCEKIRSDFLKLCDKIFFCHSLEPLKNSIFFAIPYRHPKMPNFVFQIFRPNLYKKIFLKLFCNSLQPRVCGSLKPDHPVSCVKDTKAENVQNKKKSMMLRIQKRGQKM